MGNFSRNTFDPLKDYVAVRLQQGVPVLDADWNELNDVTRQELYDALSLTFTDGVQPHGFDLEVGRRQEPNDFSMLAGAALIQGRPVRVRKNLRYSTQPWTDPQRAARDGVAVIPPLTTPTGAPSTPPRTDIVYLDVWDREVRSDEDTTLINPALGVETCMRLKREAAARVAEGTTEMPAAPAGHMFLPLALLRRQVNQPLITNIESLRPYFCTPQGTQVVSFFPAFLPISTIPGYTQKMPEWRIGFSILSNPLGLEVPKFCAVKPQNEASAGLLPLMLPDGADLFGIQLTGTLNNLVNAQLQWQLVRISQSVFQTGNQTDANRFYDILYEDTIRATSAQHTFGSSYGLTHLDRAKRIVNNALYQYVLFARTFTTPAAYFATIQGVSIIYQNFGLADPPTHEHD